jgi:hypothetical protein
MACVSALAPGPEKSIKARREREHIAKEKYKPEARKKPENETSVMDCVPL